MKARFFLVVILPVIMSDSQDLDKDSAPNQAKEEFKNPSLSDPSTPKELLSVERNVQFYPSAGIIISNHDVPFTILSDRVAELNKNYEEIKTYEGFQESPFVHRMEDTKERANNLMDAVCQEGLEKRAIFTLSLLFTGLFSLVAGVGGGVGGGFAVSYYLGGYSDRKIAEASIDIKEEVAEKQEQIELKFNKKFTQQDGRIARLENKWNLVEKATALENDYNNIISYTSLVLDLQNYNYQNSEYIAGMESKISNNEEARALMGTRQFGTSGADSLLTLSESEVIYITTDGTASCEKVSLWSKLKTIIPIYELEARPTNDENKYTIDSNRTLYTNKKYNAEDSPRRRGKKFSKLRAIVGHNSMISNINVFNNTHMFVQSKEKFSITKTCGSEELQFEMFRNPILVIPTHCSVSSQWLNISTHTLVWTDFVVATENELHTVESEDFKPYYFQQDPELSSFEMEHAIEEVFVLRKGLTSLEKEQLENELLREEIVDGVVGTFDGALGVFGDFIDEHFTSPWVALCIAIAGMAICALLIFALFKWVICKRSKSDQKVIVLPNKNPTAVSPA